MLLHPASISFNPPLSQHLISYWKRWTFLFLISKIIISGIRKLFSFCLWSDCPKPSPMLWKEFFCETLFKIFTHLNNPWDKKPYPWEKILKRHLNHFNMKTMHQVSMHRTIPFHCVLSVLSSNVPPSNDPACQRHQRFTRTVYQTLMSDSRCTSHQ